MEAVATLPGLTLSPGDLGRLMPMSIWVDATGVVRSLGPTLAKVLGPACAGRQIFDILTFERPNRAADMAGLAALAGRRLALRQRGGARTTFRGLAVRAGATGTELVLNLSFGIGAAEAVRAFGLTGADFAPTDLTVELLYLTEVKSAVTGELAALNRRLQDARDSAERRAVTDPLTGLSNRRGFEAALIRTVAAARRGTPFAIAHIDLDRFKAANDTYGHAGGDAVLAAVADVLRRETRTTDIAARLGGDEFALILPHPGDGTALALVGQRIIAGIERPVPFEGAAISVSASVGFALSDDYGEIDPDRMIADADAALYAAKRGGRGRAVVHRRF